MNRFQRLGKVMQSVLDVMQTMPSFVYLIPVVMLLGIGKVPGLIAVVIYAVPPMIRLTDLGIRLVDSDVLEAADAFGSLALAEAEERAAAAGAADDHGRHQPDHHDGARHGRDRLDDRRAGPAANRCCKAIANQYFTLGLFNGLAIVGIAIIFDRVSQALRPAAAEAPGDVVHG